MLKLEIGKTYLDGCNRKVVILKDDYKSLSGRNYIGVISLPNGFECIGSYSIIGSNNYPIGPKDPPIKLFLDLVKEYKEPKYEYFNVYNQSYGYARYPTKAEADENVTKSWGVKRIALVKINIDTGEVANEPV